MKKIYFLFMSFLLTSLAYGQATDLYFSKYGEGSSNNKFLEIYNGTGADVDLSQYAVELYANGDSTATNSLTLTGTLASGDVYVIANSSADQAILNAADTTSTVTYFNGDDAVVLTKNGNPLDVIGEVGVDPGDGWTVAGVSNATVNHTLIRKSTVCSPTTDWAVSAGTNADDSQWNVLDRDAGWDQLGSYNGCSSQPELLITSPSDGYVFNPETTDVTVEFTVNNFTVAQSGGDGYIVYSVDGGASQDKYDTDPIQLTGLSQGNHSVSMELVDSTGNSLNPAVTDQVSFTIASYTQVADLAALRAGTIGDYYEVTGEVIIIGGQENRGRLNAFVQDASAGIMIYDPNAVIDYNQYNLYDGVTNLKGKLASYAGMMELIPTVDPGTSSSNNTVTPQEVNIADFNANHDDYESELIKFTRVRIDTSGGNTVFEARTNYDLYNATDTTTLRVFFSDLAGESIPTEEVDVTGIGAEYYGHPQVYPRSINDITLGMSTNPIAGLRIYPNPVTGGNVYIHTPAGLEKSVQLVDITGKTILTTRLQGNGWIRLQVRPGIYMLRVREGNRVSVLKLLVK